MVLLNLKTDWRDLTGMFMAICALFGLLTVTASAQTAGATPKPLTDSDIQSLRSDVQADKNDIHTGHDAIY